MVNSVSMWCNFVISSVVVNNLKRYSQVIITVDNTKQYFFTIIVNIIIFCWLIEIIAKTLSFNYLVFYSFFIQDFLKPVVILDIVNRNELIKEVFNIWWSEFLASVFSTYILICIICFKTSNNYRRIKLELFNYLKNIIIIKNTLFIIPV